MPTTYVRVPATADFSASAWDFTWTMTAMFLATTAPPILEVPLVLTLAVGYPAMLWWASRPGARNGVTPACWMMLSRLRGANQREVTFRAVLTRRLPSLLAVLGFAWGSIGFALQEKTPGSERGDLATLATIAPAFSLICASMLTLVTLAVLFRSGRLADRPQWLRDAAAIRVYGDADLWSPDSWPAPSKRFKRRRS